MNKRGFSLLEIIISIGVFVLFAVGIYSGTQFVFKVVYQSRVRIIETALLNEQVETIRNLSFYDVGIVNGSPAGVLTRTVTTTRNGIDFTLTRTIRNIDDPYDGTIGGAPNDTAPADYKLVDIEVTCDHCGQRVPLTMTTTVAPKYLEGNPDNGALFIEVFDANAAPVSGATVHIVATSTSPAVDFEDTTDNDGMLRIVDLGAGVNAYSITVTKAGYTSDGTTPPTESNPNPTKPLASVIAENVTSVSFSIDHVSSLTLNTKSELCASIPNTVVSLSGTQLLGLNPEVFKVDTDVTTDGTGTQLLSNLVWDSYGIRVSGYDLLGSIPAPPIVLPPGVDENVQLILGVDTVNSLIVSVEDSITHQPLSNATVRISGNGIDLTKATGLGSIRQTDWSGGAGQESIGAVDAYFSDDGNVDVLGSVGDVQLRQANGAYVGSGSLESSIFDLGTTVNPVNLIWEPFAQPEAAGAEALRFQIATATTNTPPSWDYVGPDGTAATYYSENNITIPESQGGDQFFRYKMFMQTASSTFTPTLSDISMTYTTSCTPPGQVYFGNLGAADYTIEVTRDGYTLVSEPISVSGDMIFTVDMVAS